MLALLIRLAEDELEEFGHEGLALQEVGVLALERVSHVVEASNNECLKQLECFLALAGVDARLLLVDSLHELLHRLLVHED